MSFLYMILSTCMLFSIHMHVSTVQTRVGIGKAEWEAYDHNYFFSIMDHKQLWSICTILINFCRKEECFLGPTKDQTNKRGGQNQKRLPMIMQVDWRETGITQTPLNLWKATSISIRTLKNSKLFPTPNLLSLLCANG